MANPQLATIFPLVFSLLLISSLVGTALGKLECEDLPIEDCAFSVASSGTRCVLENYKGKDGSIKYECQSSSIMAGKQEEWIESDECINTCGLERMSVGLSTDLLLDSHFADMFCSSECLNNCPNLIDLYVSLAAGEGMYLPQLCKTHRTRRVIADPVKKAQDAEYLRSLLPKLTATDAMAPESPPIPESGAASRIPGSWLPEGPDYRGYGGTSGPTISAGDDNLAAPPASQLATVVPSPIQRSPKVPKSRVTGPGPFASKRPFFVASSPTADPSASLGTQSVPISAPESVMAPGLASDQALEVDGTWQRELTTLPDRHQVNEEDQYLYETYFH